MSDNGHGTLIWVGVCGGAVTAGMCVLRQCRMIADVQAERRQDFLEHFDEWFATTATAGSDDHVLWENLKMARGFGCDSQAEKLQTMLSKMTARKVRSILRSPDDPRHPIDTLPNLLQEETKCVAVCPWVPYLERSLTPDQIRDLGAWKLAQQWRGLCALRSFAWRYCKRLFLSSAVSCVLGTVRPAKASVEAALTEGLMQRRPAAELLPLAATACGLQLLLQSTEEAVRVFVKNASAHAAHELRLACVENVARCDTRLLQSLDVDSLLTAMEDDQEEVFDDLESLHSVVDVAGQCAVLLLQGRDCAAAQLRIFAFSCAGVGFRVLLNRAGRRLRDLAYDEAELNQASKGVCMYDVLRSRESLCTYRMHGREVELCKLGMQDEQTRREDKVGNSPIVNLLDGHTMQSVLIMWLKVLSSSWGAFQPRAVDRFAEYTSFVDRLRKAKGAVTNIYTRTCYAALRIDIAMQIPRTIDLGDDVGLRCLEEPHTLDLEGVWFGYDAEDSEAEEEAVEGGEEGEEEEEEETSGSGGEQQKRKGAVLRGIDMHIEAGTHIGIAGPSGCGKSTLMALLSRLYDPQQGVVKLGGRPLSDYNVGWLRREVVCGSSAAMELVSGSIADNVRLSRPEATTEEVREALRAACAVDFVQEKGLMTRTQHDAPDLSSGQAARVLLARALVAKPKILVLDEVSAHLDPVIEDALRKELRALRQSGTTIINISHRLSFLKDCDAVHVFGGGKIVASGRHKELLTQCAWYSDACQKQTLASRSMSY